MPTIVTKQGIKNLGVTPSHFDERDSYYAIMPEKVKRPEFFSLRAEQTPVRDQGVVGSCAAFAGCAVNEFLHEGVRILSPRHLYCARDNAPEHGMIMRDVCKIMQKQGVCTERCWPYLSHSSLCSSMSPCVEATQEARNYRIDTYRRVYGSLKDVLYSTKTPIFICVPVYEGFPNITGKFRGYHAVVMTGYSTPNLIEIKNSWGMEWGDEGYGYLADTYPITEAWVLESRDDDDDIPETNIEITKPVIGDIGFWGLPLKVNIKSDALYNIKIKGGWTWSPFIRKGKNNVIVYATPAQGDKQLEIGIGNKVFFITKISLSAKATEWQKYVSLWP